MLSFAHFLFILFYLAFCLFSIWLYLNISYSLLKTETLIDFHNSLISEIKEKLVQIVAELIERLLLDSSLRAKLELIQAQSSELESNDHFFGFRLFMGMLLIFMILPNKIGPFFVLFGSLLAGNDQVALPSVRIPRVEIAQNLVNHQNLIDFNSKQISKLQQDLFDVNMELINTIEKMNTVLAESGCRIYNFSYLEDTIRVGSGILGF